jgi:hypothetical protein
MPLLNIEKLRLHLTRMTHWTSPHNLFVTRRLGGSFEELLEIHRGPKADYKSIEEFLASSIENEFGTLPSDVAARFAAHDVYSKLQNRPATAAELSEIVSLFQPLADALPDMSDGQACSALLYDWNDKWWLIENARDFYSVRWSTTA